MCKNIGLTLQALNVHGHLQLINKKILLIKLKNISDIAKHVLPIALMAVQSDLLAPKL